FGIDDLAPADPVTERGRGRPRGSDAGRTRHHIIATARTMFSERGYAATSLRAIAGQAGVDASLISHYFGNKSGLFFETMALPVDPVAAKNRVFSAGLEGAGVRIVEARSEERRVGKECECVWWPCNRMENTETQKNE